MKEEVKRVKESVIELAKIFLTDAGEFFPFGVALQQDGDMISLTDCVEENIKSEHPESQAVIDVLETEIMRRLKEKDAIVCGLGVDVLYRSEGESKKVDAIHIMILTSTGNSVDFFVPYKNEIDEFIYDDAIEAPGTLELEP